MTPTTIVPAGRNEGISRMSREAVDRHVSYRKFAIHLGSRHFHFGVESVRCHVAAVRARAGPGSSRRWRPVVYWVTGAALVLFAFASVRTVNAMRPAERYSVALPIPEKSPLVAAQPRERAHRVVRPKTATHRPAAATTGATSRPDGAANPSALIPAAGLGDQPANGSDIRDLPAAAGQQALAVYGTEQQVKGKTCREVSVFVRSEDGKISVSPTLQCQGKR